MRASRGSRPWSPGERVITGVHEYIGFSIPAGFLILTLWTVAAWIRNKTPGPWFWRLVAILQVVLGLQIVIGGTLFLLGHRPHPNGPVWLHYVYGGLFPAALLIYAHRLARSRFEEVPWVVFGIAAFVCFGLTFRALQTGLGVD
jgi:heme A synthase